MKFHPVTALIVSCALAACASHKPAVPLQSTAERSTITVTAPALYTEHSYRGKPDLRLTYAIVKAGGGPGRFDSARLFRTLAGSKTNVESRRLRALYGKAKMAAFMETFTFAVNDLESLFKLNNIQLADPPGDMKGRDIALAVYHAGIMPNGKYDCGYMMEHLMTHPIHVVLMHDIDVARGHGPEHNANFHIILTRMILDLKHLHAT